MCRDNRQSLPVTYQHLADNVPTISIWLGEQPEPILELMNEVAKEVVLQNYPDYEHIHREIYVRITDLPLQDRIRDLRHVLLGNLVRISGVVTRRTTVLPQLTKCHFNCSRCGSVIGPFITNNLKEVRAGGTSEHFRRFSCSVWERGGGPVWRRSS